MPRLVTCPRCHVHVKLLELRCPHCDALLPSRLGATTSAVLLGLSLGRCGDAGMGVEYGVPDHEPPSIEDEKKAPPQKQPPDVKKLDDAKQVDPIPTPDPEYGLPDVDQPLAPEYGMPEPPADDKPPTKQ